VYISTATPIRRDVGRGYTLKAIGVRSIAAVLVLSSRELAILSDNVVRSTLRSLNSYSHSKRHYD